MNKSLAAVVLALGTLFFCADASFAGPVHHHHHRRLVNWPGRHSSPRVMRLKPRALVIVRRGIPDDFSA
jgi:hypothetical protein